VRGTAYTGVETVLACAVGSASHTGKTIKNSLKVFERVQNRRILITLCSYICQKSSCKVGEFAQTKNRLF